MTEKRRCESGVAITEFAISAPLIILLLVGLINLGSMLWQVHVFSDAAREGARVAANRSNFDNACANLVTDAGSATAEYMNNAGSNYTASWEMVDVQLANATWDGLSMDFVRVSTKTNSSDNCLLCFDGILTYIDVELWSSFALEKPCT